MEAQTQKLALAPLGAVYTCLTLYAHMNFSIWLDTVNLEWSNVYI